LQRARGARRHDDARGIDVDALDAVMRSDGLAQGAQTDRRRVVRMSRAQRRLAGRDDGCGGREVRLADFQMDDGASGGLEFARPRQQRHDMEGLDVRHAPRRRQFRFGHSRRAPISMRSVRRSRLSGMQPTQ
jgi:hypothetical protein